MGADEDDDDYDDKSNSNKQVMTVGNTKQQVVYTSNEYTEIAYDMT